MSELSELLNCLPVSAIQAADIAEQRGIRLPHGTIAGYWAVPPLRFDVTDLCAPARSPSTMASTVDCTWN